LTIHPEFTIIKSNQSPIFKFMNRINLLFFISFLFLLSTNIFAQWEQMPSSPAGSFRNIVDVSNILYASNVSNGIFRSTDGALTWQQVNNGLSTTEAKHMYEVMFYDGNLYAATEDGIYKSTNSGDEWIKKSSGITIGPGALKEFCISVFEYQGALLTGAYNGIYRSTDNAENWTVTNITGQSIEAKNFTIHNGKLFAARETNNNPGAYKSTDGGLTWQEIISNQFGNAITFYSEPGKLWAGAIFGMFLSTDNGLNWEERNNGLSLDPYGSSIIRINSELIISLKFGGSGIYRSSNDGINWEDFSEGLTFINSIEKLIVFDGKIIAATSDGLWQRAVSQVPVELTSFTASISGNNVNLSWSTATETNNSGFEIERSKKLEVRSQMWKKIGFVIGNGTTTEPQFYTYIDGSLTPGKYFYRLKQIDYDGTFQYSKIVEVSLLKPEEFNLEQNYPNPFNPVTIINYQLPINNFVSIKVYDVLGNEVATLINEEKPAGNYEVEFDATGLTSGVYFYQLKAGSFTEIKKMSLLK
jgi:photosystem II stability/assembly factor-like uncharacterized protein